MRSPSGFFPILVWVCLSACSLVQPARPTVVINAPPSGSQFKVGQDLVVSSISNDSQGIARVELYVDGALVDADTSPIQTQAQFNTTQTWKAGTPGTRLILVRAINRRGETSEAAVNISVIAETAALPTATATTTETSIPSTPITATPTNVPLPSRPPPTQVVVVVDTPTPRPPTATATTTRTATRPSAAVTEIRGMFDVSLGRFASVNTGCPSGSKSSGGGYVSIASQSTHVLDSYPLGDNQWTIAAESASIGTIFTSLVCVSNVTGKFAHETANTQLAAGALGFARATCPQGWVVTGAGFGASSGVEIRYVSPTTSGNNVQVYGRNNNAAQSAISAHAVCYQGAGANSSFVFKQDSVGANAIGSVKAPCPSGAAITGGGWDFPFGGVVYQSTPDAPTNTWVVFGKNFTNAPLTLSAYAYCTKF